jgi:two-component sensor histidine kinase
MPSDQATSVALVLNELLQNSLEHGFEGRHKGVLNVSFTENKENYVLLIEDDGQGLPKGFQLEQSKSLGLKIIRTVVESDLKGTFTLEDKFSGGTLATVKIPKNI